MKNIIKIEQRNGRLIINKSYEMYPDGVIYNTQDGGDIPQWIFEFRDYILAHNREMEANQYKGI